MAKNNPSDVKDQMADLTECCICTNVFTNPKLLPCVHTFCLHCLEKYGTEKKPGDKMACPICRSEFIVPDKGFYSLPNNFFISKMAEIRNLSEISTDEALCGTCSGEGRVKAKLFCLECDQNLCERCSATHSKMKLCQSHQVVEIGSILKPQEVVFRNSYCHKHPGKLIEMYCEDDKATICILCFAESHQSHRCLCINNASKIFSSSLKNDLEAVLGRLPELQAALEQLEKLEKKLSVQIVDAERQILDEAVRLKSLIDSHATILTQKLTELKNERIKNLESIKDDVERFKVSIESYAHYSNELLSKGTPGCICREADQLKTRARDLASMKNTFSTDFKWSEVLFKSLNFQDVLRRNNIANVIGDLHNDSVTDQTALISKHDAVKELMCQQEKITETLSRLKPYQLNLIRTDNFKKMLTQAIPDLEFEVTQTEVTLCGKTDAVKESKLFVLERLNGVVKKSIESSELMSRLLAKDEARLYLMDHLFAKGISASWTCKDSSVTVYALNETHFKESVAILREEVIEKRLMLSTLHLHEDFCQSHIWHAFIGCLCKKDSLLEVRVNLSVLSLACLKNSFEKYKGSIENFISSERTFHKPFGILRNYVYRMDFQWQ